MPRIKPEKLIAPDPPVALPLGTNIGGALSVALATNCQLCLLVVRAIGCPPRVRRGGPSSLDDYEVDFATEDLHKWPILLATRSNGEHMTIENSGPTRFIPPIHRYPGILDVYQRSHWIWNLATMEFK